MGNSLTGTEATVRKETAELFRRVAQVLKPPPSITLSEWADTYRYLSKESSAEPGKWHTDRAPYQREPMDAITDINIRRVVLMWAAQMGKTDCAILNPIGYYMHYDPASIMQLQPTVEMGETMSKNRLTPMIRDTPALRGLVQEKSRSGKNTIREKQFPGGYIVLQGANSPAGLAGRPIRILLADEVDRYPGDVGGEGDPLYLAHKRTTAFWNAKEVYTSTPTVKGESRIEREYENSTREVWNVPCPCCGKYQRLTWAKIKFDEAGFRAGTNMEVMHECEYCTAVSSEAEWKEAGARGKYIAENPGNPTRGFYVNALASSFTTWREITADFLMAVDESKKGNIELLKSWTNTVMAETWDEAGEQVEEADLMKRLEHYDAEVPAGVLALTAGVDTQDDRFEYEIVGWGPGAESWSIQRGIIYGDLAQNGIWENLDAALNQTLRKKDGTMMKITAACVDSGGHYSNQVYRFCKARYGRRIFAIKGKGGMNIPYISNPTTNNRVKAPLFTLGVDTGKQLIYGRLKVEEPGPGYCHFPAGRTGYDEKFFKGLTAEKKVTTYKKGKMTEMWVLKDEGFKRNEPLDMRNYAQAAMEIARIPLMWEGGHQAQQPAGRRQRSKGITE